MMGIVNLRVSLGLSPAYASLTRCITLGKLITPSEIQIPDVCTSDETIIYTLELCEI